MQEDNRIQKKCADLCGYKEFIGECNNDISCFRKIAGTLTGEEIKEHGLVIPEKNSQSDNLQVTTYDLTLGEGHYVYNGTDPAKTEKWSLVFIGNKDRLEKLNKDSTVEEQYKRLNRDKPKTLIIPPYGSAFIQLNETIDTYTVAKQKELLIVGRFDLRLSQVHQGLISQQATQVEPCYRGKLFCFIHNLSNKKIELKYGEKIATIEFSYVSCFCNNNMRKEIIESLIIKNREKYNKPFCNEFGIDEVRYFHEEEQLPDDCGLQGLNDQIKSLIKSEETIDILAKRVEKNVDKKAKWIPVIVAVIAFLGTVLTIMTEIFINEKIDGMQTQIDEQQKIIMSVSNNDIGE